MLVRFKLAELERLEAEVGYTAGHSAVVVTAFRKRMQQIRAAPDERTFYALKSLHFEKLKGNRAHQRSMRLNDQWRLILEFSEEPSGKIVVIVDIEDYH
jgi:proteic killer suppression protein